MNFCELIQFFVVKEEGLPTVDPFNRLFKRELVQSGFCKEGKMGKKLQISLELKLHI